MQPQEPPSVARLRDAAEALVTVVPNPARRLPEDLARLDARLRRWSASAESYAIIDRYDIGDTWFLGGCLSLARALARWAGGGADVWTVVNRGGQGQHWVAHAGGWLLDGDGVTRPANMQRRWRERERVRLARVEPRYVLPTSDEEEALCPPGVVFAISESLRSALGDAEGYPSLSPPRRANPPSGRLSARETVGPDSVKVQLELHLGGMAHELVGFVALAALGDEDTTCLVDQEVLARRHGLPPNLPRFFVDESKLRTAYRGIGLGTWMYAEAARLAWWRFGAVVMAGDCSPDGVTAHKARRVWDSSALRRFADVENNAMVWRERTDARVETPLPDGAIDLFLD